MINRVILCGNLCREPEVKITETNKKFVKFAIAINNGKKNGEPLPTDFFNCEAWDNEEKKIRTASFVESYTHKGTKVCIEGALKTKNWEDQYGKHSMVYVLVQSVEIMSERTSEKAPGRKEAYVQDTLVGNGQSAMGGLDDDFRSKKIEDYKEDELPFY